MVLTGAMMLDWLGERRARAACARPSTACSRTRAIAIRPDGTVAHGTRAAGQAVIDRLKR